MINMRNTTLVDDEWDMMMEKKFDLQRNLDKPNVSNINHVTIKNGTNQ